MHRDNFNDLLALGGMLFVGDGEQGAACMVFALARAGSGVPAITLSMAVVVVGVSVKPSATTGDEPSTPVGEFQSGGGAASSSPTSGIWRRPSVPPLRSACF